MVGLMARYRYTVDILPEEDGKDYYVVVPALPGCFSQGRTIEEAKKILTRRFDSISVQEVLGS